MANKPKVLFIGGGSHAWVPNAVKDLMLHPSLTASEIVLYDINLKMAEFNGQLIEKMAERLNVKMKITATDNKAAAFKGTDYAVITIAVGGLKAMRADLKIPEAFGIYHTVGDTTGPGGWIRAIRHFGVFQDIAESLNRFAPNAIVLNYTNPMAMLTDILCRIFRGPSVGLCHGLFDNIHFIQEIYKLQTEKEVNVHYGGINHFIWFTKAYAGKIDVVADLKKKLKTKTLDDIKRGPHTDAMGFSSQSELATELFRRTGVMPYIGDRHTCEFFSGYITDLKAMKRYNLTRTTIQERKKKNDDRLKRFQLWLKTEIPDHVFRHSRETAANIIDAHYTGVPFVDVANVPNVGQIQNLPLGAVVETAACFNRSGITPFCFGALPDMIEAMIRPWTMIYKMIVDACFAGDRNLAIEALRLDPVCSHLSTPKVQELAEKLLNHNKSYIHCFK